MLISYRCQSYCRDVLAQSKLIAGLKAGIASYASPLSNACETGLDSANLALRLPHDHLYLDVSGIQ